MSARHYLTVATVAGVILLARPDAYSSLFAGAEPDANPPISESGSGQDLTTTLDDQSELSLTVYNSDIALVRDVRNLQLSRGTGNLRFMDIAATVNPATVHFRSLTEPSQVSVLEQNYEYDLLDPDKLLRKYVGREVTLMRTRQDGGTTRQEEVKALLLSYNNGPVWKIGNEIVTGLNADHIRFPELPDTLYSRPTLIWTVQNDGAARHRVEASYLAGKLAWNSDYVLTVARDDKTADLNGWVTLTNNSGTGFKNAKLQLVAGDLNRVRQQLNKMADVTVTARRAMAEERMAQESFSDYHLYTVGRKTTINNSQTKQVSMFDGTDVPVVKRYVVEGQNYYYRNQQHPGSPIKDSVQVFYQFKNEEKAGLGLPMPAGVLRVYQQDSKGGTQFVGEDRIMHTPKDETLNIKIGNAFDVICERNQVDFQKIASNVYELAYEITLRNHKATGIQVEVNEPVGGTWRMVNSSHEWTKTVGLGRAVQGAGRGGWHRGAQVPRAHYLLTFEWYPGWRRREGSGSPAPPVQYSADDAARKAPAGSRSRPDDQHRDRCARQASHPADVPRRLLCRSHGHGVAPREIPGHPDVNLDNLVHVNGVWGEKSLAEVAAAVAPVDCLIASHVIEHVPDLVTWLHEVAAVLKPEGDLRLVIPDRRYTFDLLRAETVLADVLAAHMVRARIPQVRQVIDHVANTVVVDCHQLWEGTFDRTALVNGHDPSHIELLSRDVLENQAYHDVHCWVFTPASFAQLMMRLAELGYHAFKCVKLFDTEQYTNEFVVIAQRAADRAETIESWRAMHETLEPGPATSLLGPGGRAGGA